MGRIIGIDYGKRYVGIAVSDPLQIIASPLTTLPPHEVIPFLQKYTQKEEVTQIVVGLPLLLSGERGYMVEAVDEFTRLLTRYFPHIPVSQHDERLTSVMAQQALRQVQAKKKVREDKGELNKISASIILRSFMERRF